MDFLLFHPTPLTCIITALAIGAMTGFEREAHGHPAGVRTHMLVCLGSCLAATIDQVHPGNTGRIAAQVLTGVGFLGAGTILRSEKGQTIHGLTTAASVWTTAGIGIALGFGHPSYSYAVVATVLVLITLRFAHVLEHVAHRLSGRAELTILVGVQGDTIAAAVKSALDQLVAMRANIRDLSTVSPDGDASHQVVHVQIQVPGGVRRESVGAELAKNNHIVQVTWDS